MFIAFGVLLVLIALFPAILIVDGPILSSLVPLLASLGLALTSIALPPGESQRFAKLSKPIAIAAIVPVVWILLQMTPIPLFQSLPWSKLSELANPVWTSVAAGFRHSISGSISVDLGATAIALVRFLSFVGVILLATAVTISRERAESALIALTAAATLVASVVATSDIFGLGAVAARDEALDCACLGVVLAAACITFVFERHETRRSKSSYNAGKFRLAGLASVLAFAICATAVLVAHSGSIMFAASCGLVVFGGVIIVRRLDLGRWGAGAIGLTASVIAIALVTGAAGRSSDPRLAFVKKDAADVELTQRMLADAPFLGDGAGAFDALLPIYQSAAPGTGEREPVTAAAKLSIEMGRPMLWYAMAAATVTLLALLRGAAHRGRDAFHSAAAAACVATLIVQAFINIGPLGPALPLFAAAIFGLGFAQSQGRISS